MGVSIALVFHIASALAVIFLSAWGLRHQRDLQLMRGLIARGRNLRASGQRRTADMPARFVLRLARAFGVPVVSSPFRSGFSRSDEVVAIEADVLAHFFLRAPVSLIHFKEFRTIEFHLSTSSPVLVDDLESAFGGSVRITLVVTGEVYAP